MNESQQHIRHLLDRYFAAQTTPDEEHLLRDWFRSTAQIPADLLYAKCLFEGMETLAGEQYHGALPGGASTPEDRAERVVSRPIPADPRPPRRLAFVWTAAAAAVLLLGLFFGLDRLRKPYCYIDGVAVYDKQAAMQTVVYLDAFSDFEDPARRVDFLMKNQ